MPRLPKTTDQQQRDADVRAIDGYIAAGKRNGRDRHASAAALGVPYVTLWRRMRYPEDFTLGELQTIANVLNVSLPALLGGGQTYGE